MEISEDVNLVQKRVQASTKEATRAAKTGMDDIFGDHSFVDAEGGRASIAEVENYWLTYLSGGVKRIDEDEFANLLEDTDWFPADLQRALKRLIDAGKVRNLDAPRKRPKKPLHWEKGGERLALTEIEK
jgi:hypothetical protein